MTEFSGFAPIQLPEFTGDLSDWHHDVSVLDRALRDGGCDYEARLPQIVGWIPEDEQAALRHIDIERHVAPRYKPGIYYPDGVFGHWEYLEQILPQTLKIIRDDIRLLSGGDRSLEGVEVEKGLPVDPQERIVDQDLHTDIEVEFQANTSEVFYLASTVSPPEFYRGPARLTTAPIGIYEGGLVKLDPMSLDKSNAHNTIQAPSYAVVRASYATVHKRPDMVDLQRVRLRADSTREFTLQNKLLYLHYSIDISVIAPDIFRHGSPLDL